MASQVISQLHSQDAVVHCITLIFALKELIIY